MIDVKPCPFCGNAPNRMGDFVLCEVSQCVMYAIRVIPDEWNVRSPDMESLTTHLKSIETSILKEADRYTPQINEGRAKGQSVDCTVGITSGLREAARIVHDLIRETK